jgi:hypothetical protein
MNTSSKRNDAQISPSPLHPFTFSSEREKGRKIDSMVKKFLPPVWAIHLAGILFIVAGFATNPLTLTRAFFSDESVYYTMAYSFAFDGDMVFQQNDLIRVYREFAAGPQGIVLKINERDNSIVFAKAFIYSLAAAPFVRLFGTNGFFIFHGLLLWLNLLCAYRFCISIMKPSTAVLFSFFYFLANATLVYMFWMTPEYFNMSLVCYGVFFFVADEQFNSKFKLFQSPWNYGITAIFFAMATFSKITNAALIAPLGIWLLWKRRFVPAAVAFGVFIIITTAFFGLNTSFSGHWNYQSGKRAVFYDSFPYGRAGASPFAPFSQKFDGQPEETQNKINITIWDWFDRLNYIPKPILYNFGYFFFGRYSGLAIYFFPMFFALLYFLYAKKNGIATAVFAAGCVGILSYMIGLPWNYFGGSGTIGNRYLMNCFAVLLFCLTQEPSRKVLITSFVASLLFTSSFLFTPILSSFDNSYHQRAGIFKALPLERTLLADLPINTNRGAVRVAFDDPPTYLLYFADNNTYFRENYDRRIGFWVKGERECEFVLRATQKVSKVLLKLKPARPGTTVIVEADEKTQIELKEPVFYSGEVTLSDPLPYDRDNTGVTYLYHLKIRSLQGKIVKDAMGDRYLGVFVRLELPEIKSAPTLPEEKDSQ